MEQDYKTMEYLKELIRQQINIHEVANASFQKILRKIRRVYLFTVVSLIIFAAIFIWYAVRTQNKYRQAIDESAKSIKDLNTRITLQREYINMNSKEIFNFKDSTK